MMTGEASHLAFLIIVLPVLVGSLRTNGTCTICDCSVQGVVDCSNRNLTSIPRDIPADTTTLNLSSNYLQGIEKGTFRNLKNLKSLDLYNTALKRQNISAQSFEGLQSLIVLNISQNNQLPLTNVTTPENLFEHIQSLEVLSMYGTTGLCNTGQGYPDNHLCKLTRLRELSTDGLLDVDFGPGFRNMSNLKVLRLSGDLVEPSWKSKEFCQTNLRDGLLDNLVSITHLYIRKCEVQYVGKNAFQNLNNLQYLDLSKNKRLDISQLFTSFCSLPNTTTSLILNNIVPRYPNNCGTSITESMVRCLHDKSIREIHLDQNRIQYIDITALTLLPKTVQIVSASKNEFYQGLYIFAIAYMTNLTRLDISYQFFTDETSIWHKESNFKQEILDISNGGENASNDVGASGTRGTTPRNEHGIQDWKDYDAEISDERLPGGSKFQSFVERLFTGIAYKNVFGDEPDQNENNTVCPQHNKENYIPPGTIIANIPPKLEYIDLSHSKHASPIFSFYLNESNALKVIKAGNSLLYCWEGPVHGLNKLEYLDLSLNLCTKTSKHFFQYLPSLKFLNISFNLLSESVASDVEGQILSNLAALETLDVQFNRLDNIPRLFLKSQTKLKKLLLRDNLLEKFEVDLDHMTQLERLDLRGNKIGWFSENMCDTLERLAQLTQSHTNRSLVVDLRRNSVQCSCKNLNFMKWIYNHFRANSSLDVRISSCISEDNRNMGNFTTRESLGKKVENLENQCRSYTALIVALSVGLALMINIILGVLVHRFRWKLQYWYYVASDNRCTRLVKQRDDYQLITDEPRYKFDVFVASAEETKEFVIDKLRPALKQRNLVALIPVYHIQYGERLVSLIGRAIHDSRVVLFVFSKDWPSDCCMEVAVHMWQCDIVNRTRPKVLGIYFENLRGADAEKVRETFCNTFVDYPGDGDEESTFWRTVCDLIEKP